MRAPSLKSAAHAIEQSSGFTRGIFSATLRMPRGTASRPHDRTLIPTPMNVSHYYAFTRTIVVGAGALALATLHAQTSPARAASTTREKEEAVQLSAFMVTAEDDQGYYSPQSVSGTRAKTEL